MAQKTTWEQAQEALAQGDYATARALIVRLLRRDPENVDYWLFFSAATPDPKERVQALEKVLQLDPDNPVARRGLAYYRGQKPPQSPLRLDLQAQWMKTFTQQQAQAVRVRTWRPYLMALGVLMGLLVLSVLGWATWERVRPRRFGTLPPRTILPTTPRPTRTPSPTPRFTPTPIPLEQLLEATYTPTPRYLQTPHPFEAFRQALRALDRGDWEQAVFYLEDLLNLEGPTADAYFYLGEAYRKLGQWEEARQAYQRALEVDPNFGPALVGLALTQVERWEAENPDAPLPPEEQREIDARFQQALEASPDYGLGYLAWARFLLRHAQDPEAALERLEQAETLLPGSPLVAYWRAQAYLALGDLEQARAAVQQALERDITALPTYLLYARIALAQDDLTTAAQMLETYRRYRPDDPEGRFWAAELAWRQGDIEAAVDLYRDVLDALPAYRDTILERLVEGYLLLEQPEEALPLAEELLERRGEEDIRAHLLLGRVWYALERYGNAYQHVHQAVRLAEQAQDQELYYTALYWRARALSQLDQPDAARRDWQRILEAPEDFVPQAWKDEARAFLFPQTPTPTPTPTTEAALSPSPAEVHHAHGKASTGLASVPPVASATAHTGTARL